MSNTTIQVDSDGFSLNAFQQKSIQMENPLSTAMERDLYHMRKMGSRIH